VDNSRDSNFEWLMSQNLSEFEGLWVSVVDGRIVSKNKSLKRVIAAAKEKYPDDVPFVVKIAFPFISV